MRYTLSESQFFPSAKWGHDAPTCQDVMWSEASPEFGDCGRGGPVCLSLRHRSGSSREKRQIWFLSVFKSPQPGAHSREGPGNLLNQHEQNVHTSELRTVPTSSAWTPPSKAMVLLLGAVFLSVKWGKVVIQEFPQPPSPGQRGSGKAPGATVPPGGQIENSSPQVKRLQDECLQLLYRGKSRHSEGTDCSVLVGWKQIQNQNPTA